MKVEPRYDGPAVVRMDDDGGVDVGEACVRQRRRLRATLETLSDEEWRRPSRCEGWTVQDVVVHLVGTNQFWYLSLASGLAGSPTRMLVGFDPKSTPAAMVEAAPAATPAETLAQLAESTEALCALVESLEGDQWSARAEAPAGHLPIRTVVHHALWDCWIHERDILLPLGRPVTEEPDEAMACLRFVAALGPAFAVSVGRGSDAGLLIESTEPDGRVAVEVSDHVAVSDQPTGDPDVVLRGRAVDLVEALTCRAPLLHAVPDQHRWLVASLGEVFETPITG
jgi:uncharacterized protein (TIGR03083 family)